MASRQYFTFMEESSWVSAYGERKNDGYGDFTRD